LFFYYFNAGSIKPGKRTCVLPGQAVVVWVSAFRLFPPDQADSPLIPAANAIQEIANKPAIPLSDGLINNTVI